MRLVLSWLREFVDIKASAEEIADTLSLRGFEVASIESLGGGDAVGPSARCLCASCGQLFCGRAAR